MFILKTTLPIQNNYILSVYIISTLEDGTQLNLHLHYLYKIMEIVVENEFL